ncbi:hypothetical protein EDB84DRAFT_1561055 [Lactarius hengduanensis]|nr:hypothetical protein EDB84DRAFT_1561055 [Lactarius hengduanensis]
MTFPGYRVPSWRHFWAQLEELYPDVVVGTQCITEFVELSAKCRICDESDLTDDDFNSEFFKGHPDDQDVPADKSPIWFRAIQDVLSAAIRGDPERFIRRLFGDKRAPKRSDRDDAPAPERRTYETRSALVTKLKSLVVHEPSYLVLTVLYSPCQERFPNVAQHLPNPELFPAQALPTMTTVAYQSLLSSANLPTMGPADTQPSRFLVYGFSNLKDSFFSDRNGAQTRGYPAAEEYAVTCRFKIPSINSTASTTQRDASPHAMRYNFEIVPGPAISTGLRNEEGFKAFKNVSFPAKPPSPPPLPPASSTPSSSTGRTPQFRYRASAEGRGLTKQLLRWIFEGKLDQVTPAHSRR